MGFVEDTLAAPRPDELARVDLPRRLHYHPSPDSWQDEVVYFLLVDRFSDGAESTRPLLDRTRLADARPDQPKRRALTLGQLGVVGKRSLPGRNPVRSNQQTRLPSGPGHNDSVGESSLSAARAP